MELITPTPNGFQVVFDSGEVLRVAGGLDDLQDVLDYLERTPPEQRGSMTIPALGDGPATGSAVVTTGFISDESSAPVGRKVGRCDEQQASH